MRKVAILFSLLFILPLMALSPFFQNGEKGFVVRVLDGDSFVLDNGLIVRMAQIEAPFIRTNNEAGFASRAALAKMILNKNIKLKYGGLRRDKMGRALAQVYIDNGLLQNETWVQIELLRQGHARVHTYLDNRARIEDFWLAEREARRGNKGLWADPKYKIRFASPEALIGTEGSFQLIEGKIKKVKQTGRVIRLYFGEDEEKSIMALIPQQSWNLWEGGIQSILELEGKNIRIRGRINGAQMARKTKTGRIFPAHEAQIWLNHPEQIEYIYYK